MSNPEGYVVPVGPATDAVELDEGFGIAKTALVLLKVSKTIANDAMVAMINCHDSYDENTTSQRD